MKILSFLMIICKYILILLVTLLVLSVLLLIIILFVPIKYKVYLKKTENIESNIQISWLFSLILFKFNNDIKGDKSFIFEFFGIPINIDRFKKSKKTNTSTPKSKNNLKHKTSKKDNNKKTHKNKSKKENKDNNKILNNIIEFKHKKELTKDTIISFIHIIKHILPNKGMIKIEFGKDNPADTGIIVAALSMLYPLYHSFMNVIGNFEEECFYIDMDIKGEIKIGKLIYELLKFITNYSVREVIAFIKKQRKENKNGKKATN